MPIIRSLDGTKNHPFMTPGDFIVCFFVSTMCPFVPFSLEQGIFLPEGHVLGSEDDTRHFDGPLQLKDTCLALFYVY